MSPLERATIISLSRYSYILTPHVTAYQSSSRFSDLLLDTNIRERSRKIGRRQLRIGDFEQAMPIADSLNDGGY